MRRNRPTVKFALLALLLLLAAAAFAQDTQYKIRAKIDLVVVPVTVKGSGDQLVGGLTQKDFAIYEDGRRQTITNFSADPVPLSAAVVIDTGLSAASLSRVQQTFSALSGAFAKEDEVALYRYDKFVTQELAFSSNQEIVETAMKKLRELTPDRNPALAANWRGPFANIGPVINGAPVIPPELNPPPYTAPLRQPAKVLNDAIFTAAGDLGKREHHRRKIILLISDGLDSRSDHSFDDAWRILLQMNVQVYAVGLDQPFPYKKFSVLEDYARATGGDTYFVNSVQHLEKAYQSATEEARNQYVIGYVSNNEVVGAGPAFRVITVLADEGRLRARTRRGYFAYP
jgi:VWFA-related protein